MQKQKQNKKKQKQKKNKKKTNAVSFSYELYIFKFADIGRKAILTSAKIPAKFYFWWHFRQHWH